MKLTLLIATGCRPEAWALSEKMLMRQNYTGHARLLIVDDGENPQPITINRPGWTIDVVRPIPYWKPGGNTQARNLAAGLDVIGKGEWVAIWEDDDHYQPGYLSDVAIWLNYYDLVGEPRARYFNVATGVGRQLGNTKHASLCSTAVKGKALDQFRRSVATQEKFIDLNLWQNFRGKKFLSNTHHVVGIKGLPGRDGIGMGHKGLTGNQNGEILRQWIGDEAAVYGY